ncbi:4-hydroxy-tetrahydrodipicolinate synthase [soil metagenome]
MISQQKLWTALITPMLSDGSVDFESLEKLIQRQNNAGNGILLIGSTGEGLALDDEEKKNVVEFAAGLGAEVPLMVGVGGMNIYQQKKWIEHCNTIKIDAFLLITPLYAKPGPKGQLQWFKKLLDASEKPCMLYNIPSRTGIDLHINVAEQLADHPNFWAIKEASGNISVYRQFRERVPSAALYSGDDALLPAFVPFGSKGLVSVSSNVWPEETKLYTEMCLRGETESLFPLWGRAAYALFTASNPIPVKKLLYSNAEITSPELRLPLVQEELQDLSELKQIDSEIKNWFKKNNV